jgi:hypothetical protein
VTGPVDFLALTFPTPTVDSAAVECLAEVVANRDARILDLLLVVRDDDGAVRVVDVDEHLDRYGLAPLMPEGGALMSDDDVDTIASSLEPGQAAVLLVYENVWAGRVAEAVRAAGGEVALYVHVPVETVNVAMEADILARAT